MFVYQAFIAKVTTTNLFKNPLPSWVLHFISPLVYGPSYIRQLHAIAISSLRFWTQCVETMQALPVGLVFHSAFNPIWNGLFWTVSHGEWGAWGSHHNLVVIAPKIMKFDTSVKLDVLYTVGTKICDITAITSLWRHNLYFSWHIGLNFRCS